MKTPDLMRAISGGPKTLESLSLYHVGDRAPSRSNYDPNTNDLEEGQVAVVFHNLSAEESSWMGSDVAFSLVKVTKVTEKSLNTPKTFTGDYMEPALRKGHYLSKTPWPKDWYNKILVPVRCKGPGKTQVIYSEKVPIPADSVQFSFTLTDSRYIPAGQRGDVVLAVERCRQGMLDESALKNRVCNTVEDGGPGED